MDILLTHHELQSGDFPDACIQCGERDTVLVATVISTQIPLIGGAFQYQTLELPFCRDHERPPWFSLSYPAARAFTPDGVVVKNASPDFVDAIERRRRKRKRERPSSEPVMVAEIVSDPSPPLPVPMRTWVIFGAVLFLGFVVMVGVIVTVAMVAVPK